MVSTLEKIVPLEICKDFPVSVVGGKAKNLSLAVDAGYRVPQGICLTSHAYHAFMTTNKLGLILDYELYRKPFDQMRWEELWDVGLRIRSAFLKAEFPKELYTLLNQYLANFPKDSLFSVRSSATEEDGTCHSFAGVHDSFINVSPEELYEKIILVWASLWNDRSLLYRKEKQLTPQNSSMAVLVQEMVFYPISGLAFSQHPLTGAPDKIMIETVSGTLDQLVDNIKAPHTYLLDKQSGQIMTDNHDAVSYKLSKNELMSLQKHVLQLEKRFGYPVDIEWTGLNDEFTVLQVRPVTFKISDEDKDRQWYLSLSPSPENLQKLTEKIKDHVLPEMMSDIENLPALPDQSNENQLAERFLTTGECYEKWKAIYWSDFIPFAHGVRYFGQYYNDLVKPDDPYEFIDLLKTEPLLAKDRNKQMSELAKMIETVPDLYGMISKFILGSYGDFDAFLKTWNESAPEIKSFADSFKKLMTDHFTIFYENNSFADRPEIILSALLSLSEKTIKEKSTFNNPGYLENRFLQLAGKKHNEAKQWLEIGRFSWRLRDDDNILLARIEQRLWEFLREAAKKLKMQSLLNNEAIINLEQWKIIYQSLVSSMPVAETETSTKNTMAQKSSVRPRQLLGQPSSPGQSTGQARIIKNISDFKNIVPGDILIFDAVQPQMTFIISLAGAIIERRGGMLVHSSIIARELGIPAVNGVSRATELINTGDLITVNGDLGIVIIEKRS